MKKEFKVMGAVAQAVKILKDVDCRILEEMVQIDSTIVSDFKEIGKKLGDFIEPPAAAPAEKQVLVPETASVKTKIKNEGEITYGEVTYHEIPKELLPGNSEMYDAYISSKGCVCIKDTTGTFTTCWHREYSGGNRILQARIGARWVNVKPIVAYVFFGITPGSHVPLYHKDRNPANCDPKNLTRDVVITKTSHGAKSLRVIEDICRILQEFPNGTNEDYIREMDRRKIDAGSSILYKILNGGYAEISSKFFDLDHGKVVARIEDGVTDKTPEVAAEDLGGAPDPESEPTPYIEKAEGDAPDYIASHPGCYDDDVIIDILDRKNANKILTDRDVMFLIAYAVSNTRTWQIYTNRKFLKDKLGISTACLSPTPFDKLVKITKTASLYGEMLRRRFDIEDV